jgi:RimJ/RimL family protein N-acetyltransferase
MASDHAAPVKEDRGNLLTARLILRRWQRSDREPFSKLNADRRVMEFLPGVLQREASDELLGRIERHFEQHDFGLFAAELRETQTLIGFVGLAVPGFDAPFMPAVEIGWRLAAEHWGKGLATEGAREVLRYGFEKVGLDEIVSFTVPANGRSRRVMEKVGMTCNPADDFEHPGLPPGHPLRRHVLYRLRQAEWRPR